MDQLKILRNFGGTISNLVLENLFLERNEKILEDIVPQYVIKYCSKSLRTLQIRSYYIHHSMFNSVGNPFTNLKKLYIQRSRLYCYESNSWEFGGAIFPNLQTLKINLNRMGSGDAQKWNDFQRLPEAKMEFQTLPVLKSFAFDGTLGQHHYTRNYTDIIDMIKLNTQLEKFEIALIETFDENFFDDLMQSLKCLPNLRRINLIFAGPKSVFSELNTYHFDNVMDFGLFNIPSTFSIKIPFTFNRLKRFIIKTAEKGTEHLNHANIWDFIGNNKHLTSIFLHGEVNGSIIKNNEHALSNVEELYIQQCNEVPIDTVLGFLKNRLKQFKISGINSSRMRDNYFNFCDSLKFHEIDFKTNSYLRLLECFIKNSTGFPLINCFIECNPYSEIEIYSKNKLNCYIPPINWYYTHYSYGPSPEIE